MKPKALLTHRLFPEVLGFLQKNLDFEICPEREAPMKADIISRLGDKEGLLCLLTDDIGRDVIETGPRLRIIANCAVGYNNIDIACAREKGILVTNTPGVLTETTAELTWALILAVARNVPQADRFVRGNAFAGWKMDLLLGQDIRGKRLGIIGLGRIGRAVARMAAGFGLKIVYYDLHRPSHEEETILRASFLPLDDLLRTADIVSIHASMTPDAYHLLSAEKIRLMKKQAFLVNVARGPIVDERALAEALEEKRIWGAGLDVYEREPEIEKKLLSLDNVVLLPHLGSATFETRLRMAMTAAKNLVQGLSGERPDNLVT
jgi:glyoxylate reductase